ncbi:MAG: hypothetical protein Q8865_05450 [Bacillota bacterium]|nr:hypothetical protein [Bacillota bacterium]
MYYKKDPFDYTKGYVLVLPDNTIYFRSDTPEDIKERFTKNWSEYLLDIEDRHKNGDYSRG